MRGASLGGPSTPPHNWRQAPGGCVLAGQVRRWAVMCSLADAGRGGYRHDPLVALVAAAGGSAWALARGPRAHAHVRQRARRSAPRAWRASGRAQGPGRIERVQERALASWGDDAGVHKTGVAGAKGSSYRVPVYFLIQIRGSKKGARGRARPGATAVGRRPNERGRVRAHATSLPGFWAADAGPRARLLALGRACPKSTGRGRWGLAGRTPAAKARLQGPVWRAKGAKLGTPAPPATAARRAAGLRLGMRRARLAAPRCAALQSPGRGCGVAGHSLQRPNSNRKAEAACRP
ncbi:MAG: hypothetical protein J3K34DRAFT_398893 [Monoraphidium minutum]|nr:MAG: hypothetical protein J3K34DRAFT_398893 [Monoraphidium minutum]